MAHDSRRSERVAEGIREEVARFLSKLPVEVIGANCSVGPQGVLAVVAQMTRETKKYISAQPNAGSRPCSDWLSDHLAKQNEIRHLCFRPKPSNSL